MKIHRVICPNHVLARHTARHLKAATHLLRVFLSKSLCLGVSVQLLWAIHFEMSKLSTLVTYSVGKTLLQRSVHRTKHDTLIPIVTVDVAADKVKVVPHLSPVSTTRVHGPS